MKTGNKVTAYKYNRNDELLRTDTLNTGTEEDSVVIYKYDKNGNQLATVNRYEIPADRKDSTYVDIDVTLGDNRLNENVVNHYNALNQLTQTLTGNYKVSFAYDAEGLRTSKTVNGEKTVFVWDGDQLVMELTESGKVRKRYIRGNDLVYADKGTDTEKQYYVTDPHGNVVQLADESGKVTKTYEYDSFGNEVKPDSKDDNPFRYCGEYYDKETGEVYLRARYYQPAVGRFLTRDSYTGQEDEPESLHLYTYCGNDGVNSVDPSGHKFFKKTVKKIDVCVDGPLGDEEAAYNDEIRESKNYPHGKPYGDADYQQKTGLFLDHISADKVPYVVIPYGEGNKEYEKYVFSLAVIICKKEVKELQGGIKIKEGDYLYCVVGETNDKLDKLNEVSIYAAWKLLGLNPENRANKELHIGGALPEEYGDREWEFRLYDKSSPQVYIKKENRKRKRENKRPKPIPRHAGWGETNSNVNDSLKKYGRQKYGKGKEGRCLNYKNPKKIK